MEQWIMSIKQEVFGKTAAGLPVSLFTLANAAGMTVKITNYGGTIVQLHVPDRTGRTADIVLGYDTLAEYEAGNNYFGALIGRCGNRINAGKFALNGKIYQLAVNEMPQRNTHLHGGVTGFNRMVWDAATSEADGNSVLKLSRLSSDGEEGYPGNLNVTATYTLTADNRLMLEFDAVTDALTIVNLTAHSYFNLGGHDSGPVTGHELKINASRFTPINSEYIPSGELRSVRNTPFDFLQAKPVGRDVGASGEQLANGGGYDHNFIIDRKSVDALEAAAEVYDPASGRVMTVLTTQPGVQFYSGNFLNDNPGKQGARYPRRGALCLEPQHYPDAPNHAHFPSIELLPGQDYHQAIVYQFTTR